MKSLQVVRTHISPYQKEDFLFQEKCLVESFGLKYRTLTDFHLCDTILITNTHTELRELPQDLLAETRLIIHPNSGYDHFSQDLELCKKIPVVIGHTVRAQGVAEYSINALFQGLQELPQHYRWTPSRTWERTLLQGTKVWLFGFGHIGKIIARTLTALGVDLTIVDPYETGCLKSCKEGDLPEARVIISALSLNPLTRKIFDQSFFSALSDEVLFINGARGNLVCERSLREYLLAHPKSFAFLDVFSEEPFGEDWHGFPQVWKTSHIAGVDRTLDQKILDFEKNVLENYLNLDEERFLELYRKELLQNKLVKGVLI